MDMTSLFLSLHMACGLGIQRGKSRGQEDGYLPEVCQAPLLFEVGLLKEGGTHQRQGCGWYHQPLGLCWHPSLAPHHCT